LRPERDQLQNCFDNALAELENWLKASKHTKLNHMSQAIKYIYINLNIGYGNETFIITMIFLGVQIDNIFGVCIHRCSSVCFAMVEVTGLMTTDTLYFNFTMSF